MVDHRAAEDDSRVGLAPAPVGREREDVGVLATDQLQDRGEEGGSLVLLDSCPGGATADPETLDVGDLLRGLGVDVGEDAGSLTYEDAAQRLRD